MGTLYKIVVFLAASASLSMAQSLSVSGVVKDSITGALLDAASVSLLHCGLADSTDAAGAFTLVRQSAGVRGLDGGAALLARIIHLTETRSHGEPLSEYAGNADLSLCLRVSVRELHE